MQFGINFDLRNPRSPATDKESVKLVREWAKVEGVVVPVGVEPEIFWHEAVPGDWRTHPTLTVSFAWDGGSDSS